MGKTSERTTLHYDALTGLPKLNLLKNKITDLISPGSGEQITGADSFAIIYIEVDNFRYLVDTYGTKAGNEVIKCISNYLTCKIKEPHFIARIARDKFAIVIDEFKSNTKLVHYIENIINNACTKCSTNYIFYISMSAGIAVFPDHGRDLKSLLKNTETAMFTAKSLGSEINIYSDQLKKDIVNQIQMVNKLQVGIEKEEFTLFYQPEFNLHTNEIIGVEALVRWPHPENGFISPNTFIPIAEKSKQIYALEQWIVNNALKQKLKWEEDGLEHIELSINLSSKTLESESNFQKIEQIIASYKVDYTKIIFEITETVIISHVDTAIERLNRLREYGIRIALDDFGTGFSSLTHIMKLPIDIIKIDRSFIKSIPKGNEETVITKNILSLAQDLNYRVVAEGIETQEQLEYLKLISCDRGQGYLLCTPLPSDKVYEVLRSSDDCVF
ncbi:bifunctional diguanylate cyclase/phosphodiesterase [Mobilitalea sibirica]|uniref:Bifunctional diguanylate cyclase/phosphodiesterase n=1 Tax=Mobilitalea sibirica TaxID=1462919 RepID=A0A8J7H860_9FIRM|nr:bifunctional diguanylate cyclase/phosphodiesterase [Mobilitalea sibirica]MBH1940010.1 bifunctional diguanylate cyclase/phosphodiesterase [Mobilitalea sibirica]